MNVAFVGNFEKHKGSELYKELMRDLKYEHTWYILGTVKDPAEMLRSIEMYVSVVRKYHWGGLPKLFRKFEIDVVLLLHLLPESFSFTFFETMTEEMPCIVSDLGFPRTFFADYPYFVNVERGSSELKVALQKLGDETERERVRNIIRNFKKEKYPEMIKKSRVKFDIIERMLADSGSMVCARPT